MNGLEYTHSPPCTGHKHRSSIAIQTDSLETGPGSDDNSNRIRVSVRAKARYFGKKVAKRPRNEGSHRSSVIDACGPSSLWSMHRISGRGPWSKLTVERDGTKRRVTHWRFLPCYAHADVLTTHFQCRYMCCLGFPAPRRVFMRPLTRRSSPLTSVIARHTRVLVAAAHRAWLHWPGRPLQPRQVTRRAAQRPCRASSAASAPR